MTRYDRLPHACGETMIFENTASASICLTDYNVIIGPSDSHLEESKCEQQSGRRATAGCLKYIYVQ
jgi:hypothetical protein